MRLSVPPGKIRATDVRVGRGPIHRFMAGCHPVGGNARAMEGDVAQEQASDPVERPAHYRKAKSQILEIIEAYNLGFHLGNAVKYICRAGHKDPKTYEQDLRKALFYLQRKLDLMDGTAGNPDDTLRPRVHVARVNA